MSDETSLTPHRLPGRVALGAQRSRQTSAPSSTVDYHGWSGHGRTIHVGPVPGRKGIALYRKDGPVVDVLGYFRDESAARRFLEDMDALLGVGPEGRVLRRLPVSVKGGAA